MAPDERGVPIPSDGEGDDDEAPIDGVVISPDAYSQGEVLRHREFDRMTPAELREAERLVDLLVPRLERRRTRRYELHSHGRRLAPRAMFRQNLGTGGQLVSWVWRRQIREPRSLVVLCDISGSMERHSRLLLRFVQALSAASEVRTESFVFGTRLTRVTRLLRDRDRDRALARVADSVNDWAGGTRIGESFRTFNQTWARRSLRTSGVVIVVSDGWDRGDPALVASETARLRRNCHRLVWLNPLAGTPGYQPLAGGMRAAYPYIDDFLPAGTVASLERLGEILGGVRATDTRRGSEAASHAALPGAAGPAVFAVPERRRRCDHRPIRSEATAMKELLETLAAWRTGGVADDQVGRAVVVRTFGSAPRPEGAVLLYATDGRIAGSVSGGCVEGAAAEEIDRARATGHARVIRYGISDEQAWDVGLACGGTIDVLVEPVAPAVVIEAARGSVGAGGHGSAVVTPLPADSPPGEFGPHQPGDGAPPGRRTRRHRRRAPDRVARVGGPRRGARRGGDGGTPSRAVADGGARRPVAVHRGLPGPAAARPRRRRRGRPLARPARPRARVRDGRRRRPDGVRHAGALPRRRSARHRLAGRGGRRDRARARTTRSRSCRTT